MENEKLSKEKIDTFWGTFLKETNRDEATTKHSEVFHFELTEKWANELLIIPFSDITYDICKREGEDDILETWVDGHVRFFEADGKQLGYVFTYDMPVVFEDFEVVYQV